MKQAINDKHKIHCANEKNDTEFKIKTNVFRKMNESMDNTYVYLKFQLKSNCIDESV